MSIQLCGNIYDAMYNNQIIRLRSRIKQPDYVIIKETAILNEIDVLEGMKKPRTVFINTKKSLSIFDNGLNGWQKLFIDRSG